MRTTIIPGIDPVLEMVLIILGLPTIFFVVGFLFELADYLHDPEAVQAQQEFEETCRRMRKAQHAVARIKPLAMRFEWAGSILGDIKVCTGVEIPEGLKCFRCDMERRPWNRCWEDELRSILIFAKDSDTVVNFMNCYQIKDKDAAGFEFGCCNFIYDGCYCPLTEVSDIKEAMRYTQHAFKLV